jgi:hypothetical protein
VNEEIKRGEELGGFGQEGVAYLLLIIWVLWRFQPPSLLLLAVPYGFASPSFY